MTYNPRATEKISVINMPPGFRLGSPLSEGRACNLPRLESHGSSADLEFISRSFSSFPRLTCLQALTRLLTYASDDELNQAFSFQGHEGNAKDAITKYLLEYMEGAYAYDIRLQAASGLWKIGKSRPELRPKVLLFIKESLDSSDFQIRTSAFERLTWFGSRESFDIAIDALSNEKIGEAFNTMLASFDCREYAHSVSQEELTDGIAKMLIHQLDKLVQYRAPDYAVFIINLVQAVDIARFASHFSAEEKQRFSNAINYPAIETFAVLSIAYVNAAFNNEIYEIVLDGTKVRYIHLPESRSHEIGRFAGDILAISKDVPDALKQVVLYHEFIERKSGSHDIAMLAELRLVDELGLQGQYVEWMRTTSRIPVSN
jgi:hypothetical protein